MIARSRAFSRLASLSACVTSSRCLTASSRSARTSSIVCLATGASSGRNLQAERQRQGAQSRREAALGAPASDRLHLDGVGAGQQVQPVVVGDAERVPQLALVLAQRQVVAVLPDD